MTDITTVITGQVVTTVIAQSTATVLSTDATISLDMMDAILTGTAAQSFETGMIARLLDLIDVPTDVLIGIPLSILSIAKTGQSGRCLTQCVPTFIGNTKKQDNVAP